METKVYFNNINGLRFLAALCIVVHHVEQIKHTYGLQNFWGSNVVEMLKHVGVVCFFVLSGFLFGYKILEKEQLTPKEFLLHRFRKFYPLYFVLVVTSLFVFPKVSLFQIPKFDYSILQNPLLPISYIAFLPNVALAAFVVVPFLAHTWFLGVLEQTYVVIILAIQRFKIKKVFITILLLYLIVRVLLKCFYSVIPTFFDQFIHQFNIDCVVIGGLFALVWNKEKFQKILCNNVLFIFSSAMILSLLIFGVKVPFVLYEILALLFGVVIYNFAKRKKLNIGFENRVFNLLGKISFEIFLFHPIAIVLGIKLVTTFQIPLCSVYLFGFCFTVLFAWIMNRLCGFLYSE
ncbi:MAG: acyltransferase [Paludibacteraceae bacterium]|nr:acyltransferase [Paludibacteraceae bacterium]